MVDQLNLEKMGIPTVTVVTAPFLEQAKALAVSEGIVDAPLLAVPHPIGMLFAPEVLRIADNAFPDILRVAMHSHPSELAEASKKGYPAERLSFVGSVEDINRNFFSKGWSLGLPIMPPTSNRVCRMLKATRRKPDEVLGQVPPRMGTLTVELAAAHAVMAGSPPEVLPVLLSSLEAFMAPEANWLGTLSTTGTTQFIVIVNGRVTKETGIAFAQGAAGKGHYANASIGYAVNLIAYVVGGSRPPAIDRSTLASPSDYVCWVFGENEKALPKGWEPFHVERGFKPSDSVVTVMASYPPVENIDHWSVSAEEYMRWWSHIVSPMQNMGGPCSPAVMEQNPIVALGPEHAQLLASAGWNKDAFRKYFWEQTQIPISGWPSGCTELARLEAKTGLLKPDDMIPIVHLPEQLIVIIAGGEGKHSHYFSPFPGAYPVSKLIEL